MSTLPQRTYDYTKYNLKINNLISFQKPVNSGEGETISKLYNGIEKIAIENQKIKKVICISVNDVKQKYIKNLYKCQ